MPRQINGRTVTKYSSGAWFYDDSEVAANTPDAREHDGKWFLLGSGVAVE